MKKVFETMLQCMQAKENTVFVVIIEDEGSVPRGKGSVMLVGERGCLAGSIGGGAVEAESVRRGQQCLQGKRSETKKYDLSLRSQTLGMACGGEVRVTFRYVDAENTEWKQIAQELIARMDRGRSGWLLLKTDDTQNAALTDESGEILVGDAEWKPIDVHKCPLSTETCIIQENAAAVPYEGEERAILFGAGHIGKALTPILKSVGFRVTVMDDRAEYVTKERLPDAVELICGDFRKAAERVHFEAEDYVVIMTSGHVHDFEVEEQALRFDTAYVGVVGSKKKIKTVNEKLKAAGISEEKISGICTPIGIPIKSVTPEEIAVSIAAEMIKVRGERWESRKEN